jgi:hypothetical protein
MKYILLVLFSACASPKPDPHAERLKVKREIDSIELVNVLLEGKLLEGGKSDTSLMYPMGRNRNTIDMLKKKLDSIEWSIR